MRRDGFHRRQKQARDGFTFAELLLVLGVLLIITGLVFPPVLRMMADQPLKEAAERARAQLATVRIKALDSSAAWQLRFEPGGSHYLWMPTETNVAAASSGSSTDIAIAQPMEAIGGPQVGELPKGVTFSSDINGVPLTVERLPQELVIGMANAYEMSQIGWSAPVTFQADGSADDSEFAVVDSTNRQIRLTIRGFTGGVTVSPIEIRRR